MFAFSGIASLSFAVWAHHMFTTGQVNLTWFSVMTFLIAVPTGIKFFNWIGTMWGGKLRFPVPMLFALGFLPIFLVGGITGVFLSERIGRWHFWHRPDWSRGPYANRSVGGQGLDRHRE